MSIIPRFSCLAVGALLACFSQGPGLAAENDVLGQAPKQYAVEAGWGDVSADKIALQNCHAMQQDASGRLIMINTGPANNVIIYNAEGKMVQTWGTSFPGVHGIAVTKDATGEYLWLTDHDRHQVIKTTLTGTELTVIDWPKDVPPYTKADQYKPTDIEFADDGTFYVCDGYGQAMILHYNTDGTLLRTFGGKGKEPQHLNTPHGCTIDRKDPANPVLAVASRGHQAIKRYKLDGTYIDTIPLPGAAVCDVMIRGDYVYVPNLNGFLTILDRNYKVISNIAGSAPTYDANGVLQKLERIGDTFIHPHNLYVDKQGAIYVAQWNSKGTHPIKLAPVK
jgi:sugar lactone lactonase YvrE